MIKQVGKFYGKVFTGTNRCSISLTHANGSDEVIATFELLDEEHLLDLQYLITRLLAEQSSGR